MADPVSKHPDEDSDVAPDDVLDVEELDGVAGGTAPPR